MKLDFSSTQRGFALIEFEDDYRNRCSLQKSSIARGPHIWLGLDDANPQILARDTPQGGTGWVPFPVPENVSLSTRMHLSQETVAALIPVLQHFVETGEITPTETPRIEVAASTQDASTQPPSQDVLPPRWTSTDQLPSLVSSGPPDSGDKNVCWNDE